MSIDFHLDSVREVADEVVPLAASDGSHHFKVRRGEFSLYLCLTSNFPSTGPRMTTLSGLSLYKGAWKPSSLLGEEVKAVLQYLEGLWGGLRPSSIDFGAIRRIASECEEPEGMMNDSLSRKTLLIGRLPSVSAISDAIGTAVNTLESATSSAEAMAGAVSDLNAEVLELRAGCSSSMEGLAKGFGTRDGIRGALLGMRDEKDRLISEAEGVACRAKDQRSFDEELGGLFALYKEMHILELQAKLVRSL